MFELNEVRTKLVEKVLEIKKNKILKNVRVIKMFELNEVRPKLFEMVLAITKIRF